MGRLNDLTLYRQRDMDNVLYNNLTIDGQKVYVYGDTAFILRPWLKYGLGRAFSIPEQFMHHKCMISVREAVKWSYMDLKKMCSSQDY